MKENHQDRFNEHRKFLFSIAYRMLGSVMDAEDMVQETFLRWRQATDQEIASPKAYLATIITRLCINHLNSARVQREQYVGAWLPEPLITTQSPDTVAESRMAESLSMAFLILLESLSPVERATLLLRDVFDYDYSEIAAMLGKSEANCRQILLRARRRLTNRRTRFDASPEQQERLMQKFTRAAAAGDMEGLLSLLTDDITFWSDGGGRAAATLRPVHGRERVARLIVGALRKLAPPNRVARLLQVNGQPGVINYVDGCPQSVVILDTTDNQVRTIYIITNPDKLKGVISGE
jgi:RNA polymerase sigma-70 factor (ECF subfamily)